MGCKCKETSDGVGKYTDDGKPVLEKIGGARKFFAVFFRVILGILFSAIVIVLLPLLVIYVVFTVMFGGEVKINLKKWFRLNGGK